jgi:hypothetical protein
VVTVVVLVLVQDHEGVTVPVRQGGVGVSVDVADLCGENDHVEESVTGGEDVSLSESVGEPE